MADAHPEWQIVLVGPVVKIDPATPAAAPEHPLPGPAAVPGAAAILAGWDVCLMPFALNEATRFISPTKVLEYMAAALPIVSTAITDVANPYGHIVAIAATTPNSSPIAKRRWRKPAEQPPPWPRACARSSPPPPGTPRSSICALLIDGTPAAIRRAACRGGANAKPQAGAGGGAGRAGQDQPVARRGVGQGSRLPDHRRRSDRPVGGLSQRRRHHAAGTESTTVGGWCRSIEDNGFTFDYAGHIMFSNDPYVLKLYDILLGDNVHWQNARGLGLQQEGVHPLSVPGRLYGLPPEVIKECIVGAINARYGEAGGGQAAPACPAGKVDDCCADGSAERRQ
jgi:UDP-galactopyranose mutase